MTGELYSKPLDREVTASYTLLIQGRDGGSTPRSATCTLTVTVLDENDNNPVFSQEFYSQHIRESVLPNTSIMRVSATDADTGVNAAVTYSISNEAEGLFKINNQTGEITTAGFV